MSATLKLSRSFRFMSPTKFPIVLEAQEVGTMAGLWAFVCLLIKHSWWIVLKPSQPDTPAVHDSTAAARSPVATS
jgi:hypothetical protein